MPKSSEIEGLLSRLEAATGPDREIDAALVALFNNAMVKLYPPTDDFGPKNRWQFWSLDGAHFLGNEGSPKFKVEPYTASIDAALTLVERCLPGTWYVMAKGQTRPDEPLFAHQILDVDEDRQIGIGEGATQPLAILIALLRAISARPRP